MKTLITLISLTITTLTFAGITEDGKFEYFFNIQNGQRQMTCVALKAGIKTLKVQRCSREQAKSECLENGKVASIYGTSNDILRFGFGEKRIEATTYYRCF
jgi:hypothetical protein